MIFDTVFRYSGHFLQQLVTLVSSPVGVLVLGVVVALIVVAIFNSLRR